jgi:AbrB family looped-hinge helix DNA binding protein
LLTITSKGQITLKKGVLARLGLRPGDKVEAFVAADGSAVLRPVRASASWETVAGMLDSYVTRRVSVEEMNQAAQAGWAGQL